MTAAQLAHYDQAKEAFWHALIKHNPQLALFSERYGDSPLTFETWEPVLLAEPRRLNPGAEPHSDRSHRVPGSRPFRLPRLPGDASAPTSPAEEVTGGAVPATERAGTRIGVSSASAGPNNDRPSAARHPMSRAAEGQKEAV